MRQFVPFSKYSASGYYTDQYRESFEDLRIEAIKWYGRHMRDKRTNIRLHTERHIKDQKRILGI